MKKRNTAKVTIDIYDLDGELCESVGGPMDGEDVKEQMIDILKNDGIPVIRRHAKHEAADDQDRRGGNLPPAAQSDGFEQPMTVSIKVGDVHFVATGKYDDVMDAQAEFLAAVFEE